MPQIYWIFLQRVNAREYGRRVHESRFMKPHSAVPGWRACYRIFQLAVFCWVAGILAFLPRPARAQDTETQIDVETSTAPQNENASESMGQRRTKVEARRESDADGNEEDKPTFLDPETGDVVFNGLSWNIGDAVDFMNRYERFLLESKTDTGDELEYYRNLNGILALLEGKPFVDQQVLSGPGLSNFQKSWELLKKVASNPKWQRFDSENSRQIMTQIEAVQRALKTPRATDKERAYRTLEMRRQSIESQLLFLQQVTADPTNELGKRKIALIAEKERLEIEAKKYELEKTADLSTTMTKAQFQTFLFTLMAQRRFQHMLVASKLYQQLIADGDLGMSQKNNPVRIMTQQAEDAPITTTSFASFAGTAAEEVRRGVDAYKNLIALDKVMAADRTLFNAFTLGEYMPEIRSLPQDQRLRLAKFRETRRRLNRAMNSRDYQTAGKMLAEIKTLAPDFDPVTMEVRIKSEQDKSNLLLQKAKNLYFEGDHAAAEVAFREAYTTWPTNPNMDRKDELAEKLDSQQGLKKQLDELLARRDYEGIAENFAKLAASVHDDPARQENLKEAMENYREIEAAIAKHAELIRMGNQSAAWEAVEGTARKFPRNERLAKAFQESTVRAASYVKVVESARHTEERNQPVAALSLYLDALKQNPTSDPVRSQIRKLSQSLLNAPPAPATIPGQNAESDPLGSN